MSSVSEVDRDSLPARPLQSPDATGPDNLSGHAAVHSSGTAFSPILGFLFRQVAPAVLTLFLVTVIVFLSTNALGINVARTAMGRAATPEQMGEYRHAHGLDRPLMVQYGTWLGAFLNGDWGESLVNSQPVSKMVIPRLVYTLVLAALSLLVALPVAIGFGVYSAVQNRRLAELVLSIGNMGLASIPVFVLGILLMYVFAVKLGWAPVDSSGMAFGVVHDKARAFVLPVATLAIYTLPSIIRMTQVALRETMGLPHAQAAVLRGLPRQAIIRRHLMPNAAGPIINVVALNLIWLVGGVIVVENVFGFPGIGTLLVTSIGNGDSPTVQAVAVLMGAIFIGVSVTADLLVLLFNPRLRKT